MNKEHKSKTIITKDDVSEMLRSYKDLKQHVLQLEYELAEANPLVSAEEIIVSMALDDVSFDGHTNKKAGTDNIAMSYAKIAEGINIKHRQSLKDELCILKNKKERLEYYISLLDSKQANVLTCIYFEGLTFNQAAEKLYISPTALKSARTSGIMKLVEMYNNIIKTKDFEQKD